MKKLLLFIILFCASLTIMAQDVIVKKDGSTILSKVMEINGTEIKYKKWSNMDGPMYSINRSEVNSINYQNGEVELITTVTPSYPTAMYANGVMKRDGKNLTLDGRELSDVEVRQLVGEENYQTYLGAKKQIGLGKTYTYVFFGSLGALVASAMAYSYGGETVFYASEVAMGLVANASFPLMLIFKGIGKGRMNWVADEFNRNGKASAFSWQLSPSIMKCNSMESQNNLGLGLTFGVNF